MPSKTIASSTSLELSKIRAFPIFASLSPAELKSVVAQGDRRSYTKGTVICLEDEPGDDFFLVLDGRIKISLMSEAGKEVIVSTRAKGEFFGEMAIIEGKPRSASVTAVTDATLLSFGRSAFLRLIHQHPGIAFKLLQSLCARLREADVKIRTLALLDVYGRVARTLLDLARKEGVRDGDGALVFQRPTQEDIAKMIGTSRETVSRTMKELQDGGFFEADGKRIRIPPESLEDLG